MLIALQQSLCATSADSARHVIPRPELDSNAVLLDSYAAQTQYTEAHHGKNSAAPTRLSKAQQRKLAQVQESHRRRDRLDEVSSSYVFSLSCFCIQVSGTEILEASSWTLLYTVTYGSEIMCAGVQVSFCQCPDRATACAFQACSTERPGDFCTSVAAGTAKQLA